MQPKLFIDSKISDFNDAHKIFEKESSQFITFQKNMNKWDCFAKSESQIKILHRLVGYCYR